LVPQQDVLQADVEIGRQRERQLTLERMREVAGARLNTLLHLPTNAPLPPPPKKVKPSEALPGVESFQGQAQAHRPDLQAVAGRAPGERPLLARAGKEFYPG